MATATAVFRDLQQNPFSAFVLGAVPVFFVLAGLYEGWSLPLAVVLVVPMCLLNALAGIALRWGAFGVALFGIFLTPVFFYVVRWLSSGDTHTRIDMSNVMSNDGLAWIPTGGY